MSVPVFRAVHDSARLERWTIVEATTGAVQCRLGIGDSLADAASAIAAQTGGILIGPDGAVHQPDAA
ncbi:MAG: hypothetical protein KGL52_04710 [Rhodospirillales bacterium]|nr:hypothetical protein [Rhodospirillales bacterium]